MASNQAARRRFLQDAIQHSQAVHGDTSPHATCSECKRLVAKCIEAEGESVEAFVRRVKHEATPQRFTGIKQVVMQMFSDIGSEWD